MTNITVDYIILIYGIILIALSLIIALLKLSNFENKKDPYYKIMRLNALMPLFSGVLLIVVAILELIGLI